MKVFARIWAWVTSHKTILLILAGLAIAGRVLWRGGRFLLGGHTTRQPENPRPSSALTHKEAVAAKEEIEKKAEATNAKLEEKRTEVRDDRAAALADDDAWLLPGSRSTGSAGAGSGGTKPKG